MTTAVSSSSEAMTEDPVLFKMMAEELGDGPRTRTALILGTTCTIFMCGVLGLVITIVLNLRFGDSWIGLTGWFFALLLTSVGICFAIDRMTRGKQWADAQISGPIVQSLIDKLLFAHRFVVGGLQRKQRASALKDEAVIARGVRMVHRLAALGVPAMPAQLVETGDTPQLHDLVIDFLTDRDWVGHSSDGQKIWLTARAKNLLIQWGLLAAF